ncbi:MAG: D-beta-D-heptose 7-phosphate kinase / D-beta-D-heptose 1-phosphate adenosyltransferase [Chloroflexota bacterium]|jgi:D-beta-D-heptose 7-phosphate kinase/D-beta-D-heptose 1-phosphate adenosyltransferase|nr:D-beta-D-heptose 7-phosphate kinase / D-beta-D-heptose 1-phosphate adenosyltransferase [Chloroflexota bacterium]
MTAHPLDVIDAFAGLRVLVVGEAMLDGYLRGSVRRLSPEGPVPVIDVEERIELPGGAANTALNVRALGASASLISVIGDDVDGAALQHMLRRRDVDIAEIVADPARRTLAKRRLMAGVHMAARFDEGSTRPLDPAVEARFIEMLARAVPRHDAVIVSDYGYGVMTPRVIGALAELHDRLQRVLVVDAKQLAAYRRVGPTAVKPNYAQAAALVDDFEPDPADRAHAITRCADRILEVTGACMAAITLDGEGAVIVERGQPPYRTYARTRGVPMVVGAGDTYTATLALTLAARAPTTVAADLAAAAAAVVVAKPDTACCTARELCEQVAPQGKVAHDIRRLIRRVEGYRAEGRCVVLTSGCFDVLHRGHVTYLSQAKALGDVLIVGLNSDAGVRRLKGSARPINPLEDRMEVLAGLSCVDHVVGFDEETPTELIRALRPDVFVKGGDYTRERMPEADAVEACDGEVRILPYLDGHSTTATLRRMNMRPEPVSGMT